MSDLFDDSDVPAVLVPDVVTVADAKGRNIEDKFHEYLSEKAQSLQISKLLHNLVAIPSKENGNTAVANATVCLGDGRECSRNGYASAGQFGTDDVQVLGKLAEFDATAKAIRSVETFPVHVPSAPVVDAHLPQENAPLSSATAKEYKHRHDRLISGKQKNCLLKLARQRQVDAEQLCMMNLGKSVEELSSADAHAVIQKLYNYKLQIP